MFNFLKHSLEIECFEKKKKKIDKLLLKIITCVQYSCETFRHTDSKIMLKTQFCNYSHLTFLLLTHLNNVIIHKLSKVIECMFNMHNNII